MARIAGWLLVATLALPLAAQAQSFRCVGKDGKKYYGSAVPPQCAGQVVEQLNAQGQVIKRIDPAADEKTREAQQADAARKKQEEASQKAEARKAQALLATYSSVKEIDDARCALADNDKQTKEIQARIEELKKRKNTGMDIKA
jgi:hypothetical protein